MSTLKIFKTRVVKTPQRGTPESAGLDFYVPKYQEPLILHPGQSASIPSGIKANVPKGYALIAFNKSGIALRLGLVVGACVVDEDYQGEIHLHVINTTKRIVRIEPDLKLIQFILLPVLYADVYECMTEEETFPESSERGDGGFGSTGLE